MIDYEIFTCVIRILWYWNNVLYEPAYFLNAIYRNRRLLVSLQNAVQNLYIPKVASYCLLGSFLWPSRIHWMFSYPKSHKIYFCSLFLLRLLLLLVFSSLWMWLCYLFIMLVLSILVNGNFETLKHLFLKHESIIFSLFLFLIIGCLVNKRIFH